VSATEKPRRLTQGDILTMALTQRQGQTYVCLDEQTNGDVLMRVSVAHDDVWEAARLAESVRSDYRDKHPLQERHPVTDVEHTRNAKGETQLKSSVKSNGEVHPMQVGVIADELFIDRRKNFPLLDGTVSHDAPKKP